MRNPSTGNGLCRHTHTHTQRNRDQAPLPTRNIMCIPASLADPWCRRLRRSGMRVPIVAGVTPLSRRTPSTSRRRRDTSQGSQDTLSLHLLLSSSCRALACQHSREAGLADIAEALRTAVLGMHSGALRTRVKKHPSDLCQEPTRTLQAHQCLWRRHDANKDLRTLFCCLIVSASDQRNANLGLKALCSLQSDAHAIARHYAVLLRGIM